MRDYFETHRFALILAQSRLKASYSNGFGSFLWVFFEPLVQAGIFGLFFGFLLPQGSRPDNYALAVVIGVLAFTPIASGVSRGLASFREGWPFSAITGKPKTIISISTTYEILILALVNYLLMLLFAIVFGESFSMYWLIGPLVLVCFAPVIYSLLLLAGALGVLWPNFRRLVSSINRVLFFGSGIFWAGDKLLADLPSVAQLAGFLPSWQIVHMMRSIVYEDGIRVLSLSVEFAVTTVLLVALAGVAFLITERRGIDVK